MKKSNKLFNFLKFLLILFATLYLGVIIGYSVIGNGDLIDALDLSALKHIIDIIFN
ncbi:DNA-directed RNA polymerase subunit beta [Gemelliphila palaticanis]|uniref:DNA-directed RNA polymerase subunit beta n=1 Tax=Gemelliphila palaticanis TaxID=81950 RepID=A0ABX2SZ49_9BACL|nr:DNA-directed RNA polymerase subunit beta [Gemella palaticanis]MBF0714703.1 DNA-directed RNA polymerase subunit beta [Gemella palaticanis]NYS46633.1 DNA-directed RNA polymerase subunit beta [Gemella palaticanis]